MHQPPPSQPSYQAYLKVSDLLELQSGLDADPCRPLPEPGETDVHPDDFIGNEERLFITVHQVFELWFKVAIGELEAFHRTLGPPSESAMLPEDRVRWLVARLKRVTEVLRQGITHFDLMETLSPIDFLAFRDKLTPASGFQSVQMRKMEVLLGYPLEGRAILREGKAVKAFFDQGRDMMELDRVEAVVERYGDIRTSVLAWLSRTPIDFTGARWREEHPQHEAWDQADLPLDERRRLAADAFLLAHLRGALRHDAFAEAQTPPERLPHTQRMNRLHQAARLRYNSGLEPAVATAAVEDARMPAEEPGAVRTVPGVDGSPLETRLSDETWRFNRQVRAALLFIQTYPNAPLLSWPAALIEELLSMEQQLLIWRNRHARMVELIIGRRPGTGGSEGVSYLDKTTQHRIFDEIWHSRTFLVDRRWVTRGEGDTRAYLRDLDGFYSNLGR